MKSGQALPPGVWANVNPESQQIRRVCIVPRLSGVGGMVSFQHKLVEGLKKCHVEVGYDLEKGDYQAVLVVGGTRDLPGLWRARRKGIPVIQRLDGMNWLHRLAGIRKSGWRTYIRSAYGNQLLALIRSRLASRVVYQSEFSRQWWERVRGRTPVPFSVIYNGVDLARYSPVGLGEQPHDRWRVLMVEGSLMGGYEQGLSVAVAWIEKLVDLLNRQRRTGFPPKVELMIAGRVPETLKNQWDARLSRSEVASEMDLNWAGLVPGDQIPVLDRSAHLLYSSDIHPACPNSVIEALACGLPVVAFDTGALPELVRDGAGMVVPYGGDPWRLDPPDLDALANGALSVLRDLEHHRLKARQRAELAFGLDRMVEAYLEVLGEAVFRPE